VKSVLKPGCEITSEHDHRIEIAGLAHHDVVDPLASDGVTSSAARRRRRRRE